MIKNYFKIAFRNLWRHRWFSFINIAGLAIGITASFLIFLHVKFEMSYDDFHTKGNRIYRLVTDLKTPSNEFRTPITAWAVPPTLEKEFPEVESTVRILKTEMVVREENENYLEKKAIAADSAFFQVFDFDLLNGNPETALKAPFSIVLSETSSKRYFGDEDPLGQTLNIMDESYIATVTGVMQDIPENSHFTADVVLSMSTFTQNLNKGVDEEWFSYDAAAYILLKPNIDSDRLEAKFPAFLEKYSGEESQKAKMYATLFLEPLQDIYLYSDRGGNGGGDIKNVYVFGIVSLFILLIACINFINLTTARSVERAKEVGIRKVVGAQKQQLRLQFMGESIITCILALIISLPLLIVALPYFNELAGKVVASSIFSSPTYLLLLFCISLIIGIVAGVYPALILSSFQSVSVLKGRFSAGRKGILLRKGLVVSQFTISIVLIIGTIIIYNQTHFMKNQDLGFNKEQMLILDTGVHPSQLRFQQAVKEIPEVISTSLASSVPSSENESAYSEIENEQGDLQIGTLAIYSVDYNYISQFGLEMLAGRPFSKDFATDSTEAMILNEKAIKEFGYNSPQDALGKKFRQWGREGKIIGVVKDFHFRSLQEDIQPLSIRIEPEETSLIAIKVSTQNVKQTLASIEDKWNQFLPAKPFDYFFLNDYFNRQYQREQRFGKLLMIFSMLAIFISCLGLLGLAAYSTIQRRREIGIRKIVGASASGIVSLLSAEFLKLVFIAFLLASPLAWLLMHSWLQNFAYRIYLHWWVFALAGISAMFIAIVTVSFQALKAAIANPVKSLRTE